MLEDAFPLIVCDVEFPAGQFDDAGNVFGVHFRLGGILHQADHLGKACLFHGGPDRILDLQDKGFIIRGQCLLGIELEVFFHVIDPSHMVAAGLCVIDDHAVAAYQTVDKGLDIDCAHTGLTVGNDDAGLNNISRYNLRFETGIDDLHIHPAVCNLAAFKSRSLHLPYDRQDCLGNLHVVNPPVTVA